MFEEFLDVIHDAVAEFNWREFAFFDLRKLEFPFAGHFGRFDFFVHERDDFASALGAYKVILLRFDESALFERLDDACLRGWRSETAFFHGFGKFFVFDLLARRFHCGKKRCFGEVLGLALLFLLQF